jgi:hypothetical protein
MRPNDIISEIAFSHRPQAGVSVGALQRDGRIYVAAAFTNNGLSRSGRFYRNRHDTFSRRAAREMIAYRIIAMLQDKVTQFACWFESDISARVFMNKLRETFKPTPDETDETFSISELIIDISSTSNASDVTHTSMRMNIDNIWASIFEMADDIMVDEAQKAHYLEQK